MRARLLDAGCLVGLVALGILGASCSDANKEFDADEDPGSVRGIIRSGTADYFDENRSEKVYAIQKRDGSYVRLVGFNGAPGVRPGAEVRIYGPRTGDSIRADLIKVLDQDPEGIGQAIQEQRSHGNPPQLQPPLKNAFVSTVSSYTDTQAIPRMAKADFIKPVMEVSSYGRWTTEWTFHGPYTIPNDCGGSFFDNVGKNGTAAMKAAGVDPAQYNQIQFYINISACTWGGFGWDGHTPIRTDGKRGEYNPWSYVKNVGENVMVQEIGHNWGLAHVHFCPGAGTPSPSCSGFQEYGSPYTPMANGNNVYLNAWERIQMSFFSGCNVLTVGTSGTYDIGPLNSTCEGPQVLRFAADLAGTIQRYWYLEYRQPYGIEQANGVLLHYTADITKGGWSKCDYGGPDCPEDWVINTKGGSAADALMQAGATWTSPEGVVVNVTSLGATAKFDLTFPKAGVAPFCDLNMQPWDNKAPACTPGPQIDGGTPPGDSGTGGTGGTGGGDAGKDGAAGSAGTAGAGGATDSGLDAPPPPTPDAAGGKSGAGGMAGASGAGGAAGTTGGKGGAAGVGGTAGLGGAGGATGGASGATGTGGASGATGGKGGSGATGGSTTTGGSGGTVGGTGGGGQDDSGCSCRVPGSAASMSRASPLALMAAIGAIARRRRRRRRN
jgi:hypothetical protein